MTPFRSTMRNELPKVKNIAAKIALGLNLLGKNIENNILANHRPDRSNSPNKENSVIGNSSMERNPYSSFNANNSLMSKANAVGLDKKFVARMNHRLKEEKKVYPESVLHDEYHNMND